jgi:type IV pilus assembly protein PilM
VNFGNLVLGALREPPPEFVFEIAADGIAMSRTRPPSALQTVPLTAGIIAPSPVRENILEPDAFAEAIRKLIPPPAGRNAKRRAALILPDNCARIAVLDFDSLPAKEEERRPLINFRLRKSVPFDIDDAALSYFPQAGNKVIVAVAPSEVVAHYEAPFRAAGFDTGLVTVSSLAMLDLFPVTGSIVIARVSPGALTVLAVTDGVVTIVRSLERAHADDAAAAEVLAEIVADVYPTLAYIEDQTGSRPAKMFVVGLSNAGFGADARVDQEATARKLAHELDIPVESFDNPWPGLAGYLESLVVKAKPAKVKPAGAAAKEEQAA